MTTSVQNLEKLIPFTHSLQSLEPSLLETPLSENNWSTKEILAHLFRWDIFLIEVGIPSIQNDQTISFPDHHQYNDESAALSKQMSNADVIVQTISKRKELLQMLNNNGIPLDTPININGLTHDTSTNERFTLEYLMHDFSSHDAHHMKQIETFLHQHQS
ncbi:DinB family protein [Peribacillus acanthi]|uniref:DinB family protein n=1 Tax=Peribacillus acanthi TaxID=2171554 RepID=UPI000D3E1232|nr:DinB family protein [Peribacillus acanthi]